MASYANHYWNKLTYSQKVCLYRLVNDVVVNPREKFLNLWWSQLSPYRREQIFNDLSDLLFYERNYIDDVKTVHESDPFLTSI